MRGVRNGSSARGHARISRKSAPAKIRIEVISLGTNLQGVTLALWKFRNSVNMPIIIGTRFVPLATAVGKPGARRLGKLI